MDTFPTVNSRLRIFESQGIALAHLTNHSHSTAMSIKASLRSASKTWSSTQPDIWRCVPPHHGAIVAICVFPAREADSDFQVVSLESVELVEGKLNEARDELHGILKPRAILA